MQCPLKSNPQWASNESTFGETQAYQHYVDWAGEIPYSEAIRSNLNSIAVMDSVLANLKQRFNINYQFVEPSVIAERFGLATSDAPRAMIDTDGVLINKKKLSLEAAFHEYAHPLVEYIDHVDPRIVDNLFAELSGSKAGEYVLRKIKSDPTYLGMGYYDKGSKQFSREGKKEAIVTMIGKLAEQEFGVAFGEAALDKGLVGKLTKFIEDVWEAVVKGLGLEYLISPKSFNLKTTLKDLSTMLALTEMSLDMSGKELVNKKRALTDRQVNKHSEIFDSISIFLKEQMNQLNRSHTANKKQKRQKLQWFSENYEQQSTKMKQFLTIVDYAYEQISGTNNESFVKRLEDLVAQINSGANQIDPRKTLDTLIEFKNFAEEFGPLFSNISNTLSRELGLEQYEMESAQVGSPLHKVEQIIRAARYIEAVQRDHMNAALAAVLYPYYSQKGGDAAITELDQRLVALRKRASEIEADSKRKGVEPSKNSVYRSVMKEIEKFENLKKKLDPSYANLVDQIREAHEDIGWWDYQTTPAKLSSDPVLATFANLLKTKMEAMRVRLLGFQRTMRAELDKFRAATGKKMDFAESFYEGMYEVVSELKDKELVQVISFVNPIDMTKYNNELKVMRDEVWQLRTSGKTDEAAKKEADFYRRTRTSIPIAEIDQILAEMEAKVAQGILSKAELHEFVAKSIYHEVIHKDIEDMYMNSTITLEQKYQMLYDQLKVAHNNRNPFIQYRYSLSEIDPKLYANPNYSKLQADPAKKAFYDHLLKEYFAAQELLPPSKRMGYVVPMIRKRGWQRLADGGIVPFAKEEIQDLVGFVENDEEIFGNQATQTKGDKKYLPIYYTEFIAPEDTSVNLAENVLRFSKMANKFSELDQISEVTSAMEDVVENRQVRHTTRRGTALLNRVAQSVGVKIPAIKSDRDALLNKALEAFIDMKVYGEEQAYETFTLFGKEINAGKLANSLASWVSKATIGGDFLKAVANMTQAKLMQFIETAGNEFIDAKSFIHGEQVYYGEVVGDIMSDFGKGVPQSFWGQMLESFDPLQGDWENGFGEQISRSKLLRTLSWDAHFFGIHAGEHYAQVSMLLGMMHKKMITVNGKSIPLIKAYEKGANNKPQLRQGVDPEWAVGGKKMIEFVNTVHAVNNRLHGVYNKFDAVVAQRTAIGRLLIMFRKFAPPGIARRYKRFGVNQQTQSFDEGFYSTFFNAILDQRTELVNFLTHGMFGSGKDQLTDAQKQNINRMLYELALMGLTGLAASFASKYDDGDEDNYWMRFSEYQFMRVSSELGFYLNPRDALRIMKSPSATTNKISQLVKAVDQTFLTWDPEKLEYKRATGMWNKGDSKAVAAWLKLIGISGYNFHPEEAVKGFKLSQN